MTKKKNHLTIKEAYDLYVLLESVFPEIDPADSVLSFLLDLIANIRRKDDMILIEVASLLSGLEPDKIIEMDKEEELLEIIIDGFQENQIVDLMFFFSGLVK